MKKLTRMLCLLLALILCIFAVACGETEESSTSETSESGSTESSEEEFVLFSNLPAKDYKGAPCTFLVVGDFMSTYMSEEICPQETSYDGLKVAVAERNDLIGERFGVTIEEVRTENNGDMLSRLRNGLQTGISECDIAMPYMSDAATLALENCFFNLKEMENMHLDQFYYDQSSVRDFSVNDKLFFVTGDASLLSFACTHALVFNKDMIVDYDLENPYELVENKTWTIDKLREMAKRVTSDTDGTAGMGYMDTYGFLVNQNFAASMFVGAGQRFTRKNEKDEPEIAMGGEASANVFEKIFELINDSTASGKIDGSSDYLTSATTAGKNVWTAATESVANKRALFRAMAVIDILDLGQYECSFGVLPTPKLDDAQEEYYSRVSTIYASCFAIPTNVPDPEMSSIIIDAICQASTNTTKHAYFDVIMKERKIQDTESEEMLELIFDSRVYDLASIYNWGGTSEADAGSITGFMNSIAFSGTNTYTSTWESIKGTVEASLEETIAAYRSLK